MSALNFNKVILCGRLTADVELKMTEQGGKSFASFTLAINRPRGKDGTEQSADFIRLVAWDKSAEFIAKYFKKGDSLCVVGKIRTRSYKDREGRMVYVTEVVVDEAHFVDNKAASDAAPTYSPTPNFEPNFETIEDDKDLPF